ncbi:uncharacterized protein METZ01_LOCUS331913, partial [marine metagenome]
TGKDATKYGYPKWRRHIGIGWMPRKRNWRAWVTSLRRLRRQTMRTGKRWEKGNSWKLEKQDWQKSCSI